MEGMLECTIYGIDKKNVGCCLRWLRLIKHGYLEVNSQHD